MNSKQMFTWARYRAFARRSRTLVAGLKDAWKGEEIFCVGTGGSINDSDLDRLQGKRVIFLNNAFRLADQIRPSSCLCVITDDLRAIELRRELLEKKIPVICSTDKILNPDVDPEIFGSPFIFLMPKTDVNPATKHMNIAVSQKFGFSDSLVDGVYLGKSVLFPAIQIASFMGASAVTLVGIDMNMNLGLYYSGEIRGNWSQFNYEKDGVPYFDNLHECMLTRSRNLVNASQGGKLNALPRVWEFLSKGHPSKGQQQ